MESFTAASHHDVLALVIQIAVLLLTAKVLGEIAQRLGQPAVVGEILAGILLGPSLLSGFIPAVAVWIVPQTAVQGYLLEVVSMIGVMFLLLITGIETDIPLIRRHARTALSAAAGGLILPLISGFLLGLALPDYLLHDPERRLIFALFVAAALSISAIPVIAKVLLDLNLMRRDIGQTIIAAGMVDDTFAWILLSVIIGLSSGEAVTLSSVGQSVISVVLFLTISFTAGRWLVKRALAFVQDEIMSANRLLTLVVVLTFAWGAISHAIGLEAIFGAFVMGILFGQMPRLPQSVIHTLEAMTLGIFAPIFFAVAGLKVNLTSLLQPQLLLIALLVIAIATFGKVIGTYVGARWIGHRDHYTALAFGAGLNARGAMEIIIATIGLNLGILSQDMFSIIVLMAMVTSLMAPSALRWILKRVKPDEAELKRLRQEELAQRSAVANIHRVLLPVRYRPHVPGATQRIEARLLEKMAVRNNLSLTLLTVAGTGERVAAADYLQQIGQMFNQKELVRRVVESAKPTDAILDEAHKDYNLLICGATENTPNSESLFTPMIDSLVRFSPCPTLVVHGTNIAPNWQPKHILVPTNGSVASRNAAELAFALANGPDEEVFILHVVVPAISDYSLDTSGEDERKQLTIGHQIVGELGDLADSQDVRAHTNVESGSQPVNVILAEARRREVDLIILGTDVRPGSDNLFLGPRVERILRNAPCPVIVFNRS